MNLSLLGAAARRTVRGAAFFLAAAFAVVSVQAEERPSVPGEYAVGVADGANVNAVRAAVERATGCATTLVGRYVRMLKLTAPPESGNDTAAKAAEVDGVAWVEPNYLFKPLRADGKKGRRSKRATIGIEATPTDPRYLPDQSWYFDRIEAPAAWDIQNLASRVTVAVIDDGILYEHADLEDRMWDNDDETGPGAGNDGEDDDNNGYVDDADGWDFFENDNDPFPYDDPESQRNGFAGDRGTFVAGVVGAEANNAEGISGICWDVDLMNLRVFDERSPIFGSTLDIAEAVDYAIMEEADVILMAWVIDFNSLILRNAIVAARDADTLVVCAAGDFNRDVENPFLEYYPPNYGLENQITVLATIQGAGATADNRLATSNWGANVVHLGAPGEAIWGTDIDDVSDVQYRSENGTHGAAALVAGTAALIYAINPDLSYQRVKDLILENVDPVAALDGECETGGRLNLLQTLRATPGPVNPPPPPGGGGGNGGHKFGRDYRELGAEATNLLGSGFFYAYLDLYYGPSSTLSYDAYSYAQQAYYYALLAGLVVQWGDDTSPDAAFAVYYQYKYGQMAYTYYGTGYAYYAWLESGDDVTGAMALYLYYSTLYAYYDIQTPIEVEPKRARDK